METGLKRLWTRQRAKSKSGGRPDFKQTPNYEGHTSGPLPQLGALPFKPSQEETSKKHGGHSKTKSEGLAQELRRLAEGEIETRPQSAGRIQPVFLGVSRPVTATSLAKAVSQAADDAAQGRPATSKTMGPIAPARKKVSKARYVDIFQITAQSKSLGNKYNEDVAARNLDLRQVALANSPNDYDPKSRYQEEVATRNASIELPRMSHDSGTHSQDGTRSSHDSTNEGRALDYHDYYAYTHAASPGNGLARSDHLPQHQQPQQSRMYSMTAKTLAAQLPAIPQEPQLEPPEHLRAPGDARGYKTLQNRAQVANPVEYSPKKQPSYNEPIRLESAQQSSRGPGVLPVKTNTQANVSRPLMNGSTRGYSNVSVASMPLYRLSPGELAPTRPSLARLGSNKSSIHDDSRTTPANSGNAQDTSSVYSSSSQSKTSLKKSVNLSHRTIMDLTGEDSEVFSDAGISESYTESPVLQVAEFTPLVAAQPAVVTTPLERERRAITKSETNYTDEPSTQNSFFPEAIDGTPFAKISDAPVEEESGIPDHISEAGSITPQASAPNITFSKISTMASMSPRSSVVNSNRNASDSGRSRTGGIEGILETLGSLPETTPEVPSILVEPVDVAHPSSAHGYDSDAVPSPYVHASLPNQSSASNVLPSSRFRGKNVLPPLDEDVVDQPIPDPSYERQQIQQTQQTQHISPPPVHASPESLRSRDFVHPSNAFGVHTRDFAAIPSSSSASQQSEGTNSRPASGAKGKKQVDFAHDGSLQTALHSPIPTPAYSSTFDEEDFARKQVQAKAALLRLQKSLMEDDFQEENDIRPTSSSKSVSVPVVNSRPKVPTSIYIQRPASSKKITDDYGVSQMSYHNMVTDPSPVPSSTSSPRQATQFSNRSSRAEEDDGYPYKSNYSTRLKSTRQTFDSQEADFDNKPPASPGDVSLSSFPIPVASPAHSRQVSMQRPFNSRRNSQKSMSSTASAFSIPYHMVPGRTSSMRTFDDGFSLNGEE